MSSSGSVEDFLSHGKSVTSKNLKVGRSRTLNTGWTYELVYQIHFQFRHIHALRMVPVVAPIAANHTPALIVLAFAHAVEFVVLYLLLLLFMLLILTLLLRIARLDTGRSRSRS